MNQFMEYYGMCFLQCYAHSQKDLQAREHKCVPASFTLPPWTEQQQVTSTTCQNNVDPNSNLCDLDTPVNKPDVTGNYTVHKKYPSNVKLTLCQCEFAHTTSTKSGQNWILHATVTRLILEGVKQLNLISDH